MKKDEETRLNMFVSKSHFGLRNYTILANDSYVYKNHIKT